MTNTINQDTEMNTQAKPKNKQKRKDGLKRQAQIMSLALKLFAEKGYHSASVDEIISTAGIAKGTFYLHFEGKLDILDKIVDSNLETLYNYFSVLDISSPRPIDEIKDIYVSVALLLAKVPEFRQFSKIMLSDVIGLDNTIQLKINDFYDRIVGMSADYILQAQKDGRIIKSIDPVTASICIIGSVKEIVYRWAVLGENIDTVQAIKNMLDIYLYGILAEK